MFATKILEAFKNSAKQYSSSHNQSQAQQSDPEVNSQITNEHTESESPFRWTHEVILLLIEEFRTHQEALISGRISQKRTWQNIANILSQQGHEVTGPQCQSKFNGMKKTFKSIKDHNNKSGNNPRTWPYLEVGNGIFIRRYMAPLATCSSSTGVVKHSTNSLQNPKQPGQQPLKRKQSDSLIDALRESREIAERNRKKRHEENLKQ